MKLLNLHKSTKQQIVEQEKTLKPKTGRVKKAREQSFFSKISALRTGGGSSRVGGIRNNTFGRR